MGRAYSGDLRDQISAHVSAGYSCRAAARRFGVSPSCAIKLMQHVAKTGSATPRRQGRQSGAGKLAEYVTLLIRWVEATPNLNSLRTLTRIADQGSFAAAGRSVGLSASAIGKALTRLEARLGVRLFHRSTRSLTSTEEGAVVLARARRIVAEAEALQQDLSDHATVPAGRLRVSLPLVSEPLIGVLSTFAMAYPAIDLDLDFSDRQADLIGEGFDAAIRSGIARDTRLMSTAIGSFPMELAASPEYLDACGTPADVPALARHRCIRFRFPHDGRLGAWPLSDEGVSLRFAILSNNLEARVAFAMAGTGIALLPSFATKAPLAAGALVHILPTVSTTVPLTLTLTWPPGQYLPQRGQVFASHMREHLRPLLA